MSATFVTRTDQCREFLRGPFHSSSSSRPIDAITAIQSVTAEMAKSAHDANLATETFQVSFNGVAALMRYAARGSELEPLVGPVSPVDDLYIQRMIDAFSKARPWLQNTTNDPHVVKDLEALLENFERSFGPSLQPGRQ